MFISENCECTNTFIFSVNMSFGGYQKKYTFISIRFMGMRSWDSLKSMHVLKVTFAAKLFFAIKKPLMFN